jgi:hypothetical protein
MAELADKVDLISVTAQRNSISMVVYPAFLALL